ncbi:MAG: hypothetical protein J5999_02405 [Oscillospiraceae bacterium]|nr:hypothetical protein [Oscillospiraceae bacterium]
MKLKKIFAAVVAAAASATMMAVSAFAATVQMNADYAGDWGASAPIPKAEFEAIGGDVKVVLTVETKKPPIGAPNYLAKPMNMCVSWDAITDSLLSDTAIAKNDGFFVFAEGQTSLEFVVPESVWSEFKGYVDAATGEEDGSACLAFQTKDVIIKSAELSAADGTQGAIRRVDEEQSAYIMEGKSYEEATGAAEAAPAETEAAPAETEAAPAETEAAPAETEAAPADTTTTAPTTGNASAAAIVTVMAVAGAAALISKKRK